MKPLSPCLWFDSQAEEVANFYVSVFKDGKIGTVLRYGNEGQETHGGKPGAVMTIDFTVNGVAFTALNGGPIFKFNEAISFQVLCKTQEEIDYYWEKLGAGGDPKAQQCGWLKDKFGVSWQVCPEAMVEMMLDSDQKKVDRVTAAFLKMKKFDIAALKRAFDGP